MLHVSVLKDRQEQKQVTFIDDIIKSLLSLTVIYIYANMTIFIFRFNFNIILPSTTRHFSAVSFSSHSPAQKST